MTTRLLYVGSYTNSRSKGIYGFRFEAGSGLLTPLGLVAETTNPSFVLIENKHRLLYTVNETTGVSGEVGRVLAYQIDGDTGGLALLNETSSLGVGPCFLALDETHRYLFVANYHSGSVAVIVLLPDGRLGEPSAFVQHHGHGTDIERQKSPHPHAIHVFPGSDLVAVADLGLDRIGLYRFDATKESLTPSNPPFIAVAAGSGPRHIAVSRDGKYLYVVNEISSSVDAYFRASNGASFERFQTISTLPAGFSSIGDAAEIAIDPTGRFLYTSTRRSNTIRVFIIERLSGSLTVLSDLPSGGESPFTFTIEPDNAWMIVADQASSNLAVFQKEAAGRLVLRHKVSIECPSSVAFYPQFTYRG